MWLLSTNWLLAAMDKQQKETDVTGSGSCQCVDFVMNGVILAGIFFSTGFMPKKALFMK
jgi:hypothetical protein